MTIDFEALRAPFPADDIEWRIGRSGKNSSGIWAMCLAYLTNRAIQQRLDDVVGPANWKDEYIPWKDKGQLCGISININGEWVTKWDGADDTDIESTKGGLSDAEKRAAVKWGIGRYLYGLSESFAEVSETRQKGWRFAKLSQQDGGKSFYWQPPNLPAKFLPASKPKDKPKPPPKPQGYGDNRDKLKVTLRELGIKTASDANIAIRHISGNSDLDSFKVFDGAADDSEALSLLAIIQRKRNDGEEGEAIWKP